MNNYYTKYIKYKQKYLKLKDQQGGNIQIKYSYPGINTPIKCNSFEYYFYKYIMILLISNHRLFYKQFDGLLNRTLFEVEVGYYANHKNINNTLKRVDLRLFDHVINYIKYVNIIKSQFSYLLDLIDNRNTFCVYRGINFKTGKKIRDSYGEIDYEYYDTAPETIVEPIPFSTSWSDEFSLQWKGDNCCLIEIVLNIVNDYYVPLSSPFDDIYNISYKTDETKIDNFDYKSINKILLDITDDYQINESDIKLVDYVQPKVNANKIKIDNQGQLEVFVGPCKLKKIGTRINENNITIYTYKPVEFYTNNFDELFQKYEKESLISF